MKVETLNERKSAQRAGRRTSSPLVSRLPSMTVPLVDVSETNGEVQIHFGTYNDGAMITR